MLGPLSISALACPPRTARFLAADGTLRRLPSRDEDVFLVRNTFEDTAFQDAYRPRRRASNDAGLPLVVFERTTVGAAASALRMRTRDGLYLAPPLDCAEGAVLQQLDGNDVRAPPQRLAWQVERASRD
jgi:hypothetical protein